MEQKNIKDIFINTLERERVSRGWTQQEMADKLEMSLPGYRKMVQGLTESIALNKAYKAAQIFNLPISALIDSKDERDIICKKLYQAPEGICHTVNYYLDMHKAVTEFAKSEKEYVVDVVTLVGFLEDGVVFDSYKVERKTFDCYVSQPVHKALYISENTFLPVYAKGDIIFINDGLARNGDIAVILDTRTHRLYIRKLVIKEHYELYPITGVGKPLTITEEDRKYWLNYGHVVGHYQL